MSFTLRGPNNLYRFRGRAAAEAQETELPEIELSAVITRGTHTITPNVLLAEDGTWSFLWNPTESGEWTLTMEAKTNGEVVRTLVKEIDVKDNRS